MLTVERAKEINKDHVTEESLIIHSLNVSYAMGAMAKHFGEDLEHWEAEYPKRMFTLFLAMATAL